MRTLNKRDWYGVRNILPAVRAATPHVHVDSRKCAPYLPAARIATPHVHVSIP